MKKETEVKQNNLQAGDESAGNTIERIQHFIYENRQLISYVSVAVIVIIALLFWYKSYSSKSNTEESNKSMVAITRIMPYYDAPDYKKALFGDSSKTIRGQRVIGLLEIIEKYDGTEQANVAAFYAGNSYLALNKSEEAIKYFDMALNSSSKTVLEGANAGLGACYELKGNFEEAAAYYDKAADLSTDEATQGRYMYYAGLCYEKSGDKSKAIQVLKDVANKNKYNEFGKLSRGELARLGTVID